MGIFEGGGDYVDYTLLKKKGLLKIPEEKEEVKFKTEGGFVDFTAFGNNAPISESTSSEGINPLANFDNFGSSVSAGSGAIGAVGIDGKEMNALKIKVEDLDFKIEKFMERVGKIEAKLIELGNHL